MLFLVDANVLIDAARDYYGFQTVPEFWDWLEYQGSSNTVKIPREIYEEASESSDELGTWLRSERIRDCLILDEEVDPALVARAVAEGYASDLSDDEIQKLGRDPFLIAHALTASSLRCVVTTEVSKPTRLRANRHLPDVCGAFGIGVCNTFELARRLSFSTKWRAPKP
jgi:hypothetical protein